MYKVSYLLPSMALRFKSFETLKEAVEFIKTQPENGVLEMKYYDDINHRKPDRN